MSIPPELTNLLLALFGVGGGALGTVLVRRGKKEDTRLAEKAQTFEQLQSILNQVGVENARLRTLVEKAEANTERIRESWEQRWSRQMERCRKVTEPLVASIEALRVVAGPDMQDDVDRVTRLLEEHNQDDHPDPAPTT